MKTFEIWDKDLERATPIGYLLYYEKIRAFIIELMNDLTEWEAPLLFWKMVQEGTRTIPAQASLCWVRERIIPYERQNIGMILRDAHLKEYDEMKLLAISKGKCCMDNCFIREIDGQSISPEIVERMDQNVSECFWNRTGEIICFYKDGYINSVAPDDLIPEYPIFRHVIQKEEVLQTLKVDVGGYGISFNDDIHISTSVLRKIGKSKQYTPADYMDFTTGNIIETSQACERLGCSRQNLAYLIKLGKLTPIIRGAKENMFTKGAVERCIWD